MYIFYNTVQRLNPLNRFSPKKWFLVIKSIGRVTEKELARRLADEVTLNQKEAEITFFLAEKIIVDSLLGGKTIQQGEPGTFYLTVQTTGVDTEEEVAPYLIKRLCLRFKPAASLREKLNKAHFRKMKSLDNKKG